MCGVHAGRSPTTVSNALLRVLLGVILATLSPWLTACGSQADAAGRIADDIRTRPGVAAVDYRYVKNLEYGEQYELTVDLAPDVTTEQAQAVARAFVSGVAGAKFTGIGYVWICLRAPKFTLTVKPLLADGTVMAADDAAAQVASTFSAAAAAPIEQLSIKPGDPVRVQLTQPVDHTSVDAWRTAHPDLDRQDTEWMLFASPLTSDRSAREFTSVGAVPDPVVSRLWPDLVHAAEPSGVSGRAGPDGGTTVQIRVPVGVDDTAAALAHRVAPMLAKLDRPVLLRSELPRLEVLIGGCPPPATDHTHDDPLSQELAAQYQRC